LKQVKKVKATKAKKEKKTHAAHAKAKKAQEKHDSVKTARRSLASEDRTTADILRIRRKIWSNTQWVLKASKGDKTDFESEIHDAVQADHRSISNAQQLLKDPSLKLPKARLAEIYNEM
jgi:hypothetical protein